MALPASLLLLGAGCDGGSEPPPVELPSVSTGPVLARPSRVWHGGEAEDEAGRAVAVGDVDGDGLDELLIGAPSGFVYGPDADLPHSGAYLLQADAPSGALDDAATASFLGWKNGDYMGISVAISDDVTGDGVPDLIVGGEASEEPPVDLQVFAGPVAGTLGVEDAHASFVFDELTGPGACCANSCGDLDGDGVGEVCPGWLAGPTEESFEHSGAFVYRGPIASGELNRAEADVELRAAGWELASQPHGGDDLTGDGLADLRVSARGYNEEAGGVYVVDDPPNGTVELADYPLLTGDEGAGAGSKTVSGGDLDGDGRGDLFVNGHNFATRTGRALVVTEMTSGPLSEAHVVLDGSTEYDWFGVDGSIGDFDGDGAADLAVGIPRDWYFGFDAPGRVAVWRGPLPAGRLTEADADMVLRGSDQPDAFGVRLASGDVDGDGDADLVVGAPKDSTAGERAGAVYLILDGGL